MMSRLMLNLRDPKIRSTMTTVTTTASGNPMAFTAMDHHPILTTINEDSEFEGEVVSPIGTFISL
jgi:hypothetical protein